MVRDDLQEGHQRREEEVGIGPPVDSDGKGLFHGRGGGLQMGVSRLMGLRVEGVSARLVTLESTSCVHRCGRRRISPCSSTTSVTMPSHSSQ